MTELNFPILSFQEFLSGSEGEKRAVAQKLYDAFHTYGWVYLKNFGIAQQEVDEMFAMVCPISLSIPVSLQVMRDPASSDTELITMNLLSLRSTSSGHWRQN